MPSPTRRISALPISANETIVFRVRQSLTLLVTQVIILLILGLVFVLVIGRLEGISSPIVGSLSLKNILISVGGLAIGLVILVRLLEYLATSYTLTNRRVQHDFGIFLKTSYAIPLDQIETLDVMQSIIGRLLGYGDVEIRPTSAIVRFIEFKSIANPKNRREEVEAQLP
jgi:uncharacterized membrane protein YdbT with pleckstrin-like domain